ncbi:MAG: thymidylate synthase [Motiliproteus sp.]
MNSIIRCRTVGEAWVESIKSILEGGHNHHDEDVDMLEILGLSVSVSHPELRDSIFERYGDGVVIDNMLKKFSKGYVMDNRPFTYSGRIYDYNGINQFSWLQQRLINKRETKSATISLLYPADNDPNQPCLTTVDAKIRNEKLHLQFFFRSQNIFGRQYANFLALTHFQKKLADACNVGIGSLSGFIASAHIYAFDIEAAKLIAAGDESKIVDKYYSHGPSSVRTG